MALTTLLLSRAAGASASTDYTMYIADADCAVRADPDSSTRTPCFGGGFSVSCTSEQLAGAIRSFFTAGKSAINVLPQRLLYEDLFFCSPHEREAFEKALVDVGTRDIRPEYEGIYRGAVQVWAAQGLLQGLEGALRNPNLTPSARTRLLTARAIAEGKLRAKKSSRKGGRAATWE